MAINVIRDKRLLPAAQVRFKQRYTAIMRDASNQIGGVIARYADADGKIPVNRADEVLKQADAIVLSKFLVDGVSIRADGTPVSPYAIALMSEVYLVTAGVVNRHAEYMNNHLDDTSKMVLRGQARRIREQGPTRLFMPNPLAEYEPAHTWVDPNGYVLSQRIWRTGTETVRKQHQLLYDLIRSGASSQQISNQMEQFLLPGRAKIRTNRPYGSDASYDAMRLGRTEIARAHNQASWASAYLNPYVDQIRLVRSLSGDPTCKVCLEHAGPVGGEGVVYPVIGAIVPPLHPHCMCRVDAEVTRSAESVTAELRDYLAEANELPLLTPFQRDNFIEMLLGAAVAQIMAQMTMQLSLGF